VYSRVKCTQCYRPACACIHGYARIDDRCVYWAECPRENRRISHDRQHNLSSMSQSPATSISTTAKYSNETESFIVSSNNEGTKIHELNLTDSEVVVSDIKVQSKNISKAKFPSSLESDSDVIGDVCYGDWRWPPGCRDCDYRIAWNYLDDTDEIEFSIETRAPSNWWTGVGFSPTGTMVGFLLIITTHNQIIP
ncbi:unnamed protein product, partial [Onchocerca flexuosa]|uniref:DOMON domain-containing protein n=1 Tax=Onchocerca flexuosa TaxID=387005 RepID=A0A183HHE8_9BILA